MPTIATLHARDLTVTRGPQLILDAIDLLLGPGRCVGLIGPNGVGKSTLLQALAGAVALDRGSIRLTPPSATVGYLPQEPERSADETVGAFLARRTGVAAADAELAAATDALATGAGGADDRYGHALDRWLSLGGADLDVRFGEVWHDLGLDERLLRQATGTLSGGEAARCSLAALLLSRFDIYLLDEPTNDLDLDGLARLEAWVLGLDAGIALVSHDRAFLARTVTHVVELDEFTHRASEYAGGWDAYVEHRATARRHAWERFEGYDTKRKELAGRAQREREWATQGLSRAKKRPDDNDKNIRAFKINQTEQLAGRAARTEKAIERLDVVEKPREPWQLRLVVASTGRSGDIVVRLDGAVVERGEFRLGPVDIEIGYGERVAVVGANGSGKTTLLDALLGRQPLARGSRWFGPNVVVGEIEQARGQLGGHETVLRAFLDATGMTVVDARTLLAKFGLVGEHVERSTESLSPGERTRAALALLMANGANCLVLDEPTNHLDLPAIEQLEQALDTFAGTVLLVTHDRALLDEVRLTRTLRLEQGRIVADAPR
ncbi:MAG: ABC-F family ATP-binding cassette domain-containing protein [Acidimicrobiia bacterium]